MGAGLRFGVLFPIWIPGETELAWRLFQDINQSNFVKLRFEVHPACASKT